MAKQKLRPKIVKLCKVVGGLTGVVNKIDENAPEYYALASILTDEEADVAIAAGLRKERPLEYLVKKTGMSEKKVKELADHLAWIGVFRVTTNPVTKKDQYFMQIFAPGIMEMLVNNQELLKTILQLKHLMKGEVLDAARRIIRKVADEIAEKLQQDIRRSLLGRIDKNASSPVPSIRNLDIQKTIRKNLKHYDRENRQLQIEQVYFNRRTRNYSTWRVVIAVDESGSMLDSVIHSAVMAGIFARLPMLDTRLVIFDTQVVDLSSQMEDVVATLMSIQLGGGTYIAGALQYCEGLIENPHRANAVIPTLTAVTLPVPNFLVRRSLCKLEKMVPNAIIMEIIPA